MASNYKTDHPLYGTVDLDDVMITDSWLVDQYVGSQLWSCGYNYYGQLGNGASGASVKYSSPIQVGSLTNWKQISNIIDRHSIAVKTDGTLWTWGYNYWGGLGNGTRSEEHTSELQSH